MINMVYEDIVEGIFISRPNRFLAEVEIEGEIVTVHVKNTSRCRELLLDGARVYLEKSRNKMRKTAYSLISVEKDGRLFNIDSQAPNRICMEGIRNGRIGLPGLAGSIEAIKAEKVHGDSRLDIYLEVRTDSGLIKKAYIEVKGVTLEENGAARFPDAPTERGVKHINELRRIALAGDLAYIIFIIQMSGSAYFEPNDRMHPEFGSALRIAAANGVIPLAFFCDVKADSIEAVGQIPVML